LKKNVFSDCFFLHDFFPYQHVPLFPGSNILFFNPSVPKKYLYMYFPFLGLFQVHDFSLFKVLSEFVFFGAYFLKITVYYVYFILRETLFRLKIIPVSCFILEFFHYKISLHIPKCIPIPCSLYLFQDGISIKLFCRFPEFILAYSNVPPRTSLGEYKIVKEPTPSVTSAPRDIIFHQKPSRR